MQLCVDVFNKELQRLHRNTALCLLTIQTVVHLPPENILGIIMLPK